jgi:small GTP-binding protein
MATSDSKTYKVLVIGDASTGKTSLTHRYLTGIFVDSVRLTIGVDFFSKRIKRDNDRIKLQIWDFGGEERYRFLLPTYSKGANGAMILYDITRQRTIQTIQEYVKIVRESAGDIPILLVGSKIDLEEFREVTYEFGVSIAKSNSLSSFVEISSKENINVDETFDTLIELILKNQEE